MYVIWLIYFHCGVHHKLLTICVRDEDLLFYRNRWNTLCVHKFTKCYTNLQLCDTCALTHTTYISPFRLSPSHTNKIQHSKPFHIHISHKMEHSFIRPTERPRHVYIVHCSQRHIHPLYFPGLPFNFVSRVFSRKSSSPQRVWIQPQSHIASHRP